MRQSGILMHITSLPGPWGVGTMGKSAFEFVDFLKEAGQRSWQILPLNPTGFGDSPYQSYSTFAGNHYLIDLDLLVQEGLLEHSEIASCDWGSNEICVDYGKLYNSRLPVLKKAYERFCQVDALNGFISRNSSWLPDYALFMALKDSHGGAPWYRWEHKLKTRDADAVWEARNTYKAEIRFYCFVQYLFYKQWDSLHEYARENDVSIIGDVPIYVPYDSADVWCDPEMFQLDEALVPTAVAGCPPDAFSEDGQLWGNPLYRWDVMKKENFAWWIRRLAAAGKMYDVVRLDHFRGFEAYWSVPYGDATARNGKWIKGPDMDFVTAVKEQLPELKLIAEDLGTLTQEVLDLRDASGYPGMKVLQFAFDSREPSEYLPYRCPTNSVCYTGTHDNMTTRQWFDTATAETLEYAKEYMVLSQQEGYVWGMIRTAMSAPSDLCIVLMQDYLDLGADARMNFPGTTSGSNWSWRAKPGFAGKELAEKIAALTKLYGRSGNCDL